MLINGKKLNEFRKYWISIDHARQAKNCIRIDKQNARYFISLNRKKLRRLTGVLTGQCGLNQHLHNLGLTPSPNCPKWGWTLPNNTSANTLHISQPELKALDHLSYRV